MHLRPTPGLLLATLLTMSFALACRLTGSGAAIEADRGDDVMEDLLGGGRVFIGGLAMNRADLYLHRGLSGVDDTAFTNRWFQRLGAAISPNVVQHREGAEGMKEVLPWVTLAARAASTNTDYVLTQTFLFRAVGDSQRALEEIRRVRAGQPKNPELTLEEARIRLAMNQWDRATAALDTCATQIGPNPTKDQSPLLAEANMWRGLLFERGGESNAAAACMAHAIQLEPHMYGLLSNRVVALRAGQQPTVSVVELLAKFRRMSGNPLCAHDHDHKHGDHDDDGD